MKRPLLAISMMIFCACASTDSTTGKDPAPEPEPKAVVGEDVAPTPDPKSAEALCEGAQSCGADGPQCPEGTGCFSLAACSTPVCVATEAACEAVCGKSACAVLESYPMQLGC